jgi:hypothetical protein
MRGAYSSQGFSVPCMRLLSALISLAASFALIGCQPEEKITTATRPRLNDMKRLLAAMVPDKNSNEDKAWVFKVVGHESEIDPLVEPFDAFLKSVHFTDPDNPTWTLPRGWTQEKDKDNKLRFATIHTGPKGKSPELAVSVVQGESAISLPLNIHRWRMQLGLKSLGPKLVDVEDFLRPVSVDGVPAFVIDMTGPGSQAPMAAQAEPAPPAAQRAPFKYEIPPGWKEIPPTSQFYILSFRAADMDGKVDINVSVLSGAGGGLLANVNRWRGQVRLGELTPAQIEALPEVDIGGAKGKLVDFTGPDAPPQNNRIVGAILIREADSLFFKMMGPSNLVGRQQPAFETFLKSVNFGG